MYIEMLVQRANELFFIGTLLGIIIGSIVTLMVLNEDKEVVFQAIKPVVYEKPLVDVNPYYKEPYCTKAFNKKLKKASHG